MMDDGRVIAEAAAMVERAAALVGDDPCRSDPESFFQLRLWVAAQSVRDLATPAEAQLEPVHRPGGMDPADLVSRAEDALRRVSLETRPRATLVCVELLDLVRGLRECQAILA